MSFTALGYVTYGVVPTAVACVAMANGDSFQELPCFSGRALLLGWYSTLDDQLRIDNMPTIMKLYEAMLSVPIRMRVGPTMKRLSWQGSPTLRIFLRPRER